MKKSLISGLILLTILVLGCSQSEIIGYTYDLDKESNQVKLEDIYSFEHDIDGNQIVGEMEIGNDIVKYNAVKVDSRAEYIMYNGKLKFDDVEYNFDISIYHEGTATGLFYDESREFVKGFVIEKLIE